MSSIDQYMPCVCGSGKKFKFCKCGANQHVAEVEKILRLMDGDQDLSALDRINSQLPKLSNAAWLYALKGKILLRLGEEEAFVEVAHRFHKLKPDNPLALVFCSIAAGIDQEPIQTQARHLLAGIAESLENAPSIMGAAIDMLCQRMFVENLAALVGFWGIMQRTVADSTGSQPVVKAPFVHWYCKTPTRIISPAEDAPFLERMDEVEALATTFRYDQVEKKLLSILRDYPNQPAPLSRLLGAQVAQLDRDGAIATAQKLSQHPSLDANNRGVFQVLAWEYDQESLGVEDYSFFGEIESDDQLIEECATIPELVADFSEDARHWAASVIGEEVPAKRVFNLQLVQTAEGYQRVTQCGTLAFFGRQTDKPPRALLLVFGFPLFHELKDKLVERLKLQQLLDAPQNPRRCYTEFLSREVVIKREGNPWESLEERESRLIEEFLNYPFAVLGGLTPLMAAEKPELRETLTALAMHLEGSPQISVRVSTYREIFSRLNLDHPKREARIEEDGQLFLADFLDALRLDFEQMSVASRMQLFSFASRYGMPSLELQLGPELLNEPQVLGSAAMELTVRLSLVSLDTDPAARLQHSARIIDLCAKLEMPVGHAVMNHLQLLSRMGREDEIRGFLMQAMQRFPNDPQLVALTQKMLAYSAAQQSGQMRGMGGSTMDSVAADPMLHTSSGGLLLPGGEQPGNQAASKLWLPGT